MDTALEVLSQGPHDWIQEPIIAISIGRHVGPLGIHLKSKIPSAQTGSLCIQSELATGEPLLFGVDMPERLRDQEQAKNATVLLMDSQLGSGASALMGVRVLLDHGVQGGFSWLWEKVVP